MDPRRGRKPLQPQSFRNLLGGPWCMNSSPTSETGADVLRLGSATYKPRGCSRFTGAPLPPNGTPIPTVSLERLNERLERLAFGARPDGLNAPPLETYTTTTSENGDVVRATPEYIRWFLRAYPAAGPENRLSRAAPCPPVEGVGREGKTLNHFKTP